MRCPICEESFEPVEFVIMGQTMCPICGEIVDITDEELDTGEYHEL